MPDLCACSGFWSVLALFALTAEDLGYDVCEEPGLTGELAMEEAGRTIAVSKQWEVEPFELGEAGFLQLVRGLQLVEESGDVMLKQLANALPTRRCRGRFHRYGNQVRVRWRTRSIDVETEKIQGGEGPTVGDEFLSYSFALGWIREPHWL
jgi:hypothetical protein